MKAFQLAWASMQPDSSRKLYKFSGPTEYALQNLENGVIFCQHYSAYNDPFEFWSHIYEGIPDPEADPERFQAAKLAWGAEWMADDDEYLAEYFEACTEDQPPFRTWVDKTRIACFGTELENLLMWSHYADGLRGFCVVFDEHTLLDTEGSGFAVDVDYAQKPPMVDAFVWAIVDGLIEYNEAELAELAGKHERYSSEGMTEADVRAELERSTLMQQRILRALFATKPAEWSYERERRLLVQTDRKDELPILRKYPFEAIKQIVVGERMPLDYRRRLESVLSKTCGDVPIATARRSSSTYRLGIA